MHERTKLWYLKNLDLFSHLRDEEVKVIDTLTRMQEIKKGEVIYFQGCTDDNFYILKKGAIKITKLTPHGNEIILDILSGGTVFGEMGVIEPQERDESAIAVEGGLICIMKKPDYDRLIQEVPGLAIRVTKMIGLKRWKIETKLLDLLYRTVEQRLAKVLLNLLDDFGVPRDGGYLIKIKLTHKDYADLIASTRETVTATLNKLRNEGIIDFEGKYVVIKSMDRLKVISG
ncbi:MAG: Crp/Fnr family transcriptional regulator [Alphaproteobacteria bacterium]|uniref:Crp/Fnr family transcriptional regulator n=1 Tax=Candidatus Nitrobium versatile TaxID=2884831 RepID=A0A953JBB0_9BACT|nr:Crp/Fnr family transcriptional regulator [Candidatus Nitrobium versatile]